VSAELERVIAEQQSEIVRLKGIINDPIEQSKPRMKATIADLVRQREELIEVLTDIKLIQPIGRSLREYALTVQKIASSGIANVRL
jgi:hypothetical protein